MARVMAVSGQCFTVKPPRPYTYCPIHNPVGYLKNTYCVNRSGSYDMNWPLPPGAHLLAPFDHQVAGQSSMLRYDESTVCKPLITREHFVYQTLPDCLKEFTADYRGELEVGLAEKDGYLQLYGLCVKDESNEDLCQCSLQGDVTLEDSATLDVTKLGSGYPSSTINIASDIGDQSRCVIRVLRTGSYEMCSMPGDDNVSTPPAPKPKAEAIQAPSLNPWSLKNHKRLLDKMRKGKHRHNSFRCILLKNVVADFKHPCILDLKIGSRLHGDDAPLDKVENQTTKCAETTSSTIGVRLCGMQVFQINTGQNINLDKYQGRLLTNETFRETLARFLHNGVRYRSEFLQPIVTKLSNLIECLHTVNTYRFYASSLLIIYDGFEGNIDNQLNQGQNSQFSVEKSASAASIPDQNQTVNGHVNTRAGTQRNHTAHADGHGPRDCDEARRPVAGSCPPDSENDIHSCSPLSQNCSDSQQQFSAQSGISNHSSASSSHTSTNTSSSSSSQISNKNATSPPVFNVDVKMIDFAHTTHQGFPNEPCRHEGPDMDYIQGLTNLKALFETLLAELK